MKTPLTDEQQQLVNSFIKDCLGDKTEIGQAPDQDYNEVNHLFTVIETMGGVNIGFRCCRPDIMGECKNFYWFVIN